MYMYFVILGLPSPKLEDIWAKLGTLFLMAIRPYQLNNLGDENMLTHVFHMVGIKKGSDFAPLFPHTVLKCINAASKFVCRSTKMIICP